MGCGESCDGSWYGDEDCGSGAFSCIGIITHNGSGGLANGITIGVGRIAGLFHNGISGVNSDSGGTQKSSSTIAACRSRVIRLVDYHNRATKEFMDLDKLSFFHTSSVYYTHSSMYWVL